MTVWVWFYFSLAYIADGAVLNVKSKRLWYLCGYVAIARVFIVGLDIITSLIANSIYLNKK